MSRGASDNEGLIVETSPSTEGGSGENLLLMVHRRLRGRYPLAIVLGIAFMLPCAWVGYNAKKPEYVSRGLVQVRPQLPKNLYSTEENAMLPHYDSFIDTQAKFIESRRVLEMANNSEELKKAGWEGGPNNVSRLDNMVHVHHPRRSELIEVRAVHSDPRVAKAAVNSVLDAYSDIYISRDEASVTERQRALENRRDTLRQEIATQRDLIVEIAKGEGGADVLERRHEANLEKLENLNSQLLQVEIALAEADPAVEREEPQEERPAMTVEALAAMDPEIQALRERERMLDAMVSGDSQYGPNHRVTKQRRAELADVREQIAARADYLREQLESGMLPESAQSAQLGRLSASRLRQLKQNYTKLRDEVRLEAQRIGEKLTEIQRHRQEITDLQKYLTETTRALEAIEVEEENIKGGRIAIAQEGDTPSEAQDQRKMLAAAGGMFGFGAGFGLVFLIGLLDRGYRYIDDVERSHLDAPLLGTLPDLNSHHPEHDEMAALSVHHLRNMLVLGEGRGDKTCRVFTMTSAAAGDGKTSLTLALGMSFAVSGSRTLMLDADLVGRGLTRELNLDESEGLCQAAAHGSVNGEIEQTSIQNLWALPAGRRESFEAKHLSEDGLRAVLSTLRQRYDVILIDTGPILGSLEANLAAVNSDGVLLTIARGQNQRMVQACLERLRRMGVRCSGLVFNRASAHDFENSVSAASVVSQSLKPQSNGETGRPRREATGRGLLVRAVIGDDSENES